jgi:stage V sporulation protein G
MNITEVKVYPVDQEKLKAYVSIVLDGCFLVSDIKVIAGPAGLFVSMPSKRKKTGEFKDIAHPLNRETRQWMAERILTEYETALKQAPPQRPAPAASEADSAAPQESESAPVAEEKK